MKDGGNKRRVINSMVMKSGVMNSGGDERRVMDGVVMNSAVMDGTLTACNGVSLHSICNGLLRGFIACNGVSRHATIQSPDIYTYIRQSNEQNISSKFIT